MNLNPEKLKEVKELIETQSNASYDSLVEQVQEHLDLKQTWRAKAYVDAAWPQDSEELTSEVSSAVSSEVSLAINSWNFEDLQFKLLGQNGFVTPLTFKRAANGIVILEA